MDVGVEELLAAIESSINPTTEVCPQENGDAHPDGCLQLAHAPLATG